MNIDCHFFCKLTLSQESTHCLNRESALVRSHRVIRQTRKGLLFDLSGLVKRSKAIQECIKEDPNFHVSETDFQDLVTRAFRMVMRAVRFVDVWMEDVDFGEKANFVMETVHDQQPLDARQSKEEQSVSKDTESQAPRDYTAICNAYQPAPESLSHKQDLESISDRPRLSRSSKTFVRPGANEVEPESPRLSQSGNARASIIHRPSMSSKPFRTDSGCLASEKLLIAEGHFLGLLACFVGPHLQTRTSTDLLFTTKEVLDSCHELLAIIEAVERRQGSRPSLLEKTRDRMYGVFAEFLQAARDMLQPEMSEEGAGVSPEHLSRLGEAATACVRCTGNCVATARSVIDVIGDFQLETLGLRTTSDKHASVESEDVHPGEKVDACVFEYYPPEPTSTPPLPPSDLFNSSPQLYTNFLESEIHFNDPSGLLLSSPSQSAGFLPPVTAASGPLMVFDDLSPTSQVSSTSRVESLGVSSAESMGTCFSSLRDSGRSGLSSASTRATSPETLSTSFEDDCAAGEARVMEKTFAHELMYNKDGQVCGGSLPALVECLTIYDSKPDALFTSTFYLTFRLFAKPVEFAQALIDRFDYVKESPQIATPVRLRVYNVFKQWLETHWRNDCDQSALTRILPFAMGPLATALPSAGKRLTELVEKVTSTDGPLVPRQISTMGKTNTAHSFYVMPDTPLPSTIITKNQLASLKNGQLHSVNLSILDFDPLEFARQITIKESRIFCSILPEELLAEEWTKKTGSKAVNVRAMTTFFNDLVDLVADSILRMEDAGLRAKLIKHWIKIADKCLELNSYDSLTAIWCSLDSNNISRLKKTWEMVSPKYRATFKSLGGIATISKNRVVLRQRLQHHVGPCLPFLGMYLTDLTFVHNGNLNTRQLPNDGDEETTELINFDKHMRTAKIIGELQRFQIPYRLQEHEDMQLWLQAQITHVRETNEKTSSLKSEKNYRRSVLLEPRESQASGASRSSKVSLELQTIKSDKTSLFPFKWASHSHKDKLKQEASLSRQASLDESLKSDQGSSAASNGSATAAVLS